MSHLTSYTLAPGEVQDLCPYDQSHVVRVTRLKVHLERCRRNYLVKNRGMAFMAKCQYNEYHQYPAVEIECHEKYCPQKIQKELEEAGMPERYCSDPDSGITWNTFDDRPEEPKAEKEVSKPDPPVNLDPEENKFWNSGPRTREPWMMPLKTGDIRFANQRLGKADKKIVSRWNAEEYQQKLQNRKYGTKFHLEPPVLMDGRNVVDPEVMDMVDEGPKISEAEAVQDEGTAELEDCGSDTETIYEDATSSLGGLEDLDQDFENLKMQSGPEPEQGAVGGRLVPFSSMASLTTHSDFDDYQSCISFTGEEGE